MSSVRHAPYFLSVIRRRLEDDDRVVDFALGAHRYPLPDSIRALLDETAAGSCTRLRSVAELDRFKENAAQMVAIEYGVAVEPSAILLAPSGRSAMSGLVACHLSPGDGVLVTEPGYPAFARVAAQADGRLVSAALDPDRGFAPDLDVISGADLDGLRLAGLNYPNNPTGALLADETLAALDERLPAAATLFNDITYGRLVHDGTPRSVLSIGSDRTVLELHTFSKVFALGPQAIAFFVGTSSLVDAIGNYADFAWPQPSSLQVQLALCCLEAREHAESVRREMGERVARLREVLIGLGFEPYATPAGPYVLCPAPSSIRGTKVSGAAPAATMLLEDLHIAVTPWEAGSRGYLRFSSAYRESDLERLAALGNLTD